jgi:lipoprotein-anchoring transpeptidase ErfK/SrfK
MTRSRHSRRLLRLVPLAAVAALALAACTSTSGGHPTALSSSSGATTTGSGGQSTAATTSSAPALTPTPVHVSVNLSDGAQVGVGMPIIATFDKKITDGKAFEAATKVTVNGQPATGAWYFEYSDPASGHVMEGHFRLQNYWPGHAQIHIDLPVKGLSGGATPGGQGAYLFDDNLTLDFSTGDANILSVDDSTHMLTVTSDDKVWGTFPVSLGATDTPTSRGVKVIMEKGKSICMSGPGYNECGVKYTQRLTYGGEYLHAAPWNTYNIGHGVDSSNGCTNLYTADALKLYNFLEIGDVVTYPNANGPKMKLGDGYGDWNVPWPQWQTGGAIVTS